MRYDKFVVGVLEHANYWQSIQIVFNDKSVSQFDTSFYGPSAPYRECLLSPDDYDKVRQVTMVGCFYKDDDDCILTGLEFKDS